MFVGFVTSELDTYMEHIFAHEFRTRSSIGCNDDGNLNYFSAQQNRLYAGNDGAINGLTVAQTLQKKRKEKKRNANHKSKSDCRWFRMKVKTLHLVK